MAEQKTKVLSQRIKELLHFLKGSFNQRKLRRILGAMAFLFGLGSSPSLQAQSFGPNWIDPFGLFVSSSNEAPAFVDIDGDGDLDMMAGGNAYDANNNRAARVVYFENIGTAVGPVFGAPMDNPFGLNIDTLQWAGVVTEFVDIDGDGDMDMFASGPMYGLAYYENTGTAAMAAFANPVENPFGFSDLKWNGYPQFLDFDGDGDLDVLNSTVNADLNYSENIGSATSPMFAAPISKPFGIIDPTGTGDQLAYAAAGDLDGDGDIDILATDYAAGIYHYYENTGTATAPQFSYPVTKPSFLPSPGSYYNLPTLADLDGDGDVDLISGQYNSYNMITGNERYVMNENTTSNVGVRELTSELYVYPSLVTDYVKLDLSEERFLKLDVLDQAGRLMQRIHGHVNEIDLSGLPAGSYMIQVNLPDSRQLTAEIIKI